MSSLRNDMSVPFEQWLPPVSAIAIYAARVAELRTKRQTIAGAIRENLTLRLFIMIGTAMLLGSLVEYWFIGRYGVSWILFGLGVAVVFVLSPAAGDCGAGAVLEPAR